MLPITMLPIRRFAVLVICGLVLAACGPQAGAPNPNAGKPIKIGFLSPHTGVFAANGQDMRDGFNLYLKQHGASVAGRPIEVTFEDDAADPATGLAKARLLVEQQKVDIVVGPLSAAVGLALRDYLAGQGIPTLYPIVSADDITQRKRAPNIVRLGWSSSQTTMPFGEYAYKTLGYRKVMTMGLDFAFGWEIVGGFVKTFQEAGGKISKELWTPINTADFSPYLSQIPPDVDAVFSLMSGTTAVRFVQQYKEFGFKGRIPLIGGGTLTDQSALRSMGPEAEGIVTPLHYADGLDTPANKKFVRDYQDAYNKLPAYYGENCYTAARWLVAALEKVNGNVEDRDGLLKALGSISLTDTPRGPVKLDKYGNPVQNVYVRKVQTVNGQLVNVPIFTYPNVSQFWNYNPDDFLKQPVFSRNYPPIS